MDRQSSRENVLHWSRAGIESLSELTIGKFGVNLANNGIECYEIYKNGIEWH